MSIRQDFETFIHETNKDGSNKAGSYILALESVNRIFAAGFLPEFGTRDVFEINDIATLRRLHRILLDEGQKPGNPMLDAIPNAPSHLLGRFSAGALHNLINYLANETSEQTILAHCSAAGSARDVAQIIEKTSCVSRIFRRVVLANYHNACCLTGLNVPETLKACVIDPQGKGPETSPDNALCLSATYAAAFKAHLLTFDEELRMVLSRSLKEHATSAIFNNVFRTFEGTRLTLPTRFPPLAKHLAHHRELLVG